MNEWKNFKLKIVMLFARIVGVSIDVNPRYFGLKNNKMKTSEFDGYVGMLPHNRMMAEYEREKNRKSIKPVSM